MGIAHQQDVFVQLVHGRFHRLYLPILVQVEPRSPRRAIVSEGQVQPAIAGHGCGTHSGKGIGGGGMRHVDFEAVIFEVDVKASEIVQTFGAAFVEQYAFF